MVLLVCGPDGFACWCIALRVLYSWLWCYMIVTQEIMVLLVALPVRCCLWLIADYGVASGTAIHGIAFNNDGQCMVMVLLVTLADQGAAFGTRRPWCCL